MSSFTVENLLKKVNEGQFILKRLAAMRHDIEGKAILLRVDKAFDGIASSLIKEFPDRPSKLEKKSGYDEFTKRASIFLEDLSPHYSTLATYFDWRAVVVTTLEEIASTVSHVNLTTNFDLCYTFMDLVAIFSHLAVFFSHIPLSERRLIAAAYSQLTIISTQKIDPFYGKVTTLLTTNEWLIPEHLKSCNSMIINCLKELKCQIDENQNLTMLRQNGSFNFLRSPIDLKTPVHNQHAFNLFCSNKLLYWSVFLLLAAPQFMEKKKSIEFELTPIFSTHFVVPLYGNLFLNIHDCFEKQTKELKEAKSQFAFDSKKLMKELQSSAQSNAKNIHNLRRIFIKQELSSIISLLNDTPALMCPKMVSILAALSFAQSEIAFAVHTMHSENNENEKSKKTEEITSDLHVPELVYLTHILSDILTNANPMIVDYYRTFLTHADADAFNNWFGNDTQFSSEVKAVQKTINNYMMNVAKESSSDYSLVDLRIAFCKLEYLLLRKGSQVTLKDSHFGPFLRLLYFHSLMIDSFDETLRKCGGTEWLFYSKKVLFDLFLYNLNHSTANYGDDFFSAYFMVLSRAELIINPTAFPKESQMVLSTNTKSILIAIEHIIDSIMNCASTLLDLHVEFDQQISIDQTFLQIRMNEKNFKPPKDFVIPILPGTESMPEHFSKQANMKCRNAYLDLLHKTRTLSDFRRITVAAKVYNPKEYLREQLKGFITKNIKSLFVYNPETDQNQTSNSFLRPSIALQKLRILFFSLSTIEAISSLGLEGIWMECCLEEFSPSSLSDVTQFPMMATKELFAALKDTTLFHVVLFYRDILIKRLESTDYIYSPTLQTFVSKNSAQFKVEHYLNSSELKALVRIIGSVGVCALQTMLKNTLISHVDTLKRILFANKNSLEKIRNNYFDETACATEVANITELDLFLSKSISCGICLAFRSNLRNAQESVSRTVIPMLYHSISNSIAEFHPNIFLEQGFLKIDSITNRLGLDTTITQQDIKLALTSQIIKDSNLEKNYWVNLPVFFAIVFYSSKFRDTQYIPRLDAFQNNVHLLHLCITELMTSIQIIVSEPNEDDVQKSMPTIAADAQQNYITIASSTIYRLYQQNIDAIAQKDKKMIFADFSSLFVFMDNLYKCGTLVSRHQLETYLPYALLREAFREEFKEGKHLPDGW